MGRPLHCSPASELRSARVQGSGAREGCSAHRDRVATSCCLQNAPRRKLGAASASQVQELQVCTTAPGCRPFALDKRATQMQSPGMTSMDKICRPWQSYAPVPSGQQCHPERYRAEPSLLEDMVCPVTHRKSAGRHPNPGRTPRWGGSLSVFLLPCLWFLSHFIMLRWSAWHRHSGRLRQEMTECPSAP